MHHPFCLFSQKATKHTRARQTDTYLQTAGGYEEKKTARENGATRSDDDDDERRLCEKEREEIVRSIRKEKKQKKKKKRSKKKNLFHLAASRPQEISVSVFLTNPTSSAISRIAEKKEIQILFKYIYSTRGSARSSSSIYLNRDYTHQRDVFRVFALVRPLFEA